MSLAKYGIFKVSCISLAVTTSLLTLSISATCQNPKVDNSPLRINQAKHIIAENKAISDEAKLFIAQAETDVSNAKKLEGEARQYHKDLLIKAPLMKGKALSDARKQFNLDLKSFSDHVRKYNLHTLDVRKNYGHCKASQAAYEKMKKDLELHCDQFHMADVPPPHICIQMDVSVQEANSIMNQSKEHAIRVAQAEHDLLVTEKKLQNAITARGIVDKQVMASSALALKEQDLAAEFGRLKEEHRQLDVERRAIQRSGGSVVVPAVKGKQTLHCRTKMAW